MHKSPIFSQYICAGFLVFAAALSSGSALAQDAAPPNVLFIAVDDLNDYALDLNPDFRADTPNMDRLALRGTLFTNAHCAAPVCNPSRVSVVTGVSPATSGVYINKDDWRENEYLKSITTLPQHFKDHGYKVLGGGKLYHAANLSEQMLEGYLDPRPWDEYFPSKQRQLPDEFVPAGNSVNGSNKFYGGRFDWDALDVSDHEMGDGQVVSWAEKQLAAEHDKPLFLSVGIYRPHIPWYTPKQWFDQYPIEEVSLPSDPVADMQDVPATGANTTKRSWHQWLVANDKWDDATQAYLASVSFADAMVGRLLKALDEGPLAENTIVVLWSDHGYHLGHKQHWEKRVLWEQATHVPLIVADKRVAESKGKRCSSPVSLLDIYPTLSELCGLEKPSHLEGHSLKPLLQDSDVETNRAVVTTYQFNNHSVRSKDWRYIRYADGTEELYDHRVDHAERNNLASRESLEGVKQRLATFLPKENAPQKNKRKAKTTTADSRPNIVLMIADDMNWDDCGCYGHPSIRTPNIDRLAAEGLRFEHAYLTTNSCSPSRASIITGRYPHNTGAEQLHWPIPAGTSTFVQELKKAGYYTAAAGKWHIGNAVRDHFDKIYEASTAGFVLPSGKDGKPPKMIATQPSGCEDWEKALDERDKSKPFFMWLAALDPHREYKDGALDPPHKKSDVIVPPHLPDTPDVREDLRLYYDEIGRLDNYVGKVMTKLADQDVADNTLVLFISDNGRPFPRDKTTLYDGGIRTPWIVRWPNNVAAGKTTNALVSSVDIASTLMELAGLASEASLTEGNSFAAVLGDPTYSHRQYAFGEDHWHDYEDHARCVVDGRFKLIRNDYVDLPSTPSADAGRGLSWQNMLKLQAEGKLPSEQQACFRSPRPRWELYDLQRDPGELSNRGDDPAYTSVKFRLQTALTAWTNKTDDYVPSKRTPDEFDRVTGEPDHSVRKRPRPSKQDMFGTNSRY